MMRISLAFSLFLGLFAAFEVWAATLEEVTFLAKIETYEAVVNTTLVTQEGKKIPINRGTKLNVAGFTGTEAFIISRTDNPNGFVRKSDIARLGRSDFREDKLR